MSLIPMTVTVPPGVMPGQTLAVQAPDGQQMQVTVPPGVMAGQQLDVHMPISQPPPATQPAEAAFAFPPRAPHRAEKPRVIPTLAASVGGSLALPHHKKAAHQNRLSLAIKARASGGYGASLIRTGQCGPSLTGFSPRL